MASRLYQIPERQREVMNLAAQGIDAHQIAAILGISTRTARWHRKLAIASLGASDIHEAIEIFRDLCAEAERVAA